MSNLRESLASAQAEVEKGKAQLATEKTTHQSEMDTLRSTHAAELAKQAQACEEEKGGLGAKMTSLEAALAKSEEVAGERQDQINRLELKKFAEAFDTQEKQYRSDAKTWFWRAAIMSLIVVVITWILIASAQGAGLWYNRIIYYLLDVILITLLAFTLRQYSYYVKLSIDYGNRRTLAQSYFNILDSADDDDEVIRRQFLDKISTILAAPAEVSEEVSSATNFRPPCVTKSAPPPGARFTVSF